MTTQTRHALDLDAPELSGLRTEVVGLLAAIADRRIAERDRLREAGVNPPTAATPCDLAARVARTQGDAERSVREAPETAHLAPGDDVLEYAVVHHVACSLHDVIFRAGSNTAGAGVVRPGDLAWAENDNEATYAARRTQARRAATVAAKKLARQTLAALPDDGLTVGFSGQLPPQPAAEPWRYIFWCGYHAWGTPSQALTAEVTRLLGSSGGR